MTVASPILSIHAISCCFMAGLIWFVQIVHYPLMAAVGDDRYRDYQVGHERRTSLVVLPVMIVELATALLLIMAPPDAIPARQIWLGGALLFAVWLSTFAVQVPCHRRLRRGFDRQAHRRLVASNWIRTALWSARAGLVGYWLSVA